MWGGGHEENLSQDDARDQNLDMGFAQRRAWPRILWSSDRLPSESCGPPLTNVTFSKSCGSSRWSSATGIKPWGGWNRMGYHLFCLPAIT